MTDEHAGARSPLLLAIDQGTSSTKAVLVDRQGVVTARITVPVGASHPRPGWVEQDAIELADSVRTAVDACVQQATGPIAGIGLSTQRESAVAWDRATGKPVGPMLGWQDRRTTAVATDLIAAGHAADVRARTGLPVDPMFSALKLQWLLDEVDPDRTRSTTGQIAVGTVDSWLLHNLTGEHRIETGNASRTQLLNLDKLGWDDDLLALFGVPAQTLPRLAASDEPSDVITGIPGLDGIPVYAVLADSHAALFAHGVRDPGAVKATYGSGSSVMGLLAPDATVNDGLVRTVAWDIGTPVLGFEGNILSSGSTLTWLCQLLGVDHDELAALAASAANNDGVDLVPAFAGLGAPWWDERAQAVISGLGLGTSRQTLARAAFESIVLQIEDVLAVAEESSATPIQTVLVDGGPSANDWLVQLQADLGGRTVERAEVSELSAIGAAHLAGIGAGMWSTTDVQRLPRERTVFAPTLSEQAAASRRTGWRHAIGRSRYRG